MRMLRYFVQRVENSILGLTRVRTLGCLLASVLQAASPKKVQHTYAGVPRASNDCRREAPSEHYSVRNTPTSEETAVVRFGW